jgi:dTDP-4-amino-4,6-dideoxygalactose transaminase
VIPAEGDPRAPLRFQRPSLPSAERIERYLDLSRQARWFSNEGPCWRLLSERLAEIAHAHCVPVASGTAGLMAAIAAVGDGRRRGAGATTALLPSFTFVASAQAALWAGMRPRLLDIDSAHWHLDPALLEDEIRDSHTRVGVVLAVSTFGTPPPAETRTRWERACRRENIPLVIDSAAAFGAIADDGVPVGSQGDVEVVSFHATKPFAIGEGGAVFTRSRALYERVKMAVTFGFTADRTVGFEMGFNGKMSELHAAAALAVLDEYDAILQNRRNHAHELRRRSELPVTWQEGCERSTWQFVPVAFASPDDRTDVIARCRDAVEVRTYYDPIHAMPTFSHLPTGRGGVPQTEGLCARLLCLPMANDLSPAERDRIASMLCAQPERQPPAIRTITSR